MMLSTAQHQAQTHACVSYNAAKILLLAHLLYLQARTLTRIVAERLRKCCCGSKCHHAHSGCFHPHIDCEALVPQRSAIGTDDGKVAGLVNQSNSRDGCKTLVELCQGCGLGSERSAVCLEGLAHPCAPSAASARYTFALPGPPSRSRSRV